LIEAVDSLQDISSSFVSDVYMFNVTITDILINVLLKHYLKEFYDHFKIQNYLIRSN